MTIRTTALTNLKEMMSYSPRSAGSSKIFSSITSKKKLDFDKDTEWLRCILNFLHAAPGTTSSYGHKHPQDGRSKSLENELGKSGPTIDFLVKCMTPTILLRSFKSSPKQLVDLVLPLYAEYLSLRSRQQEFLVHCSLEEFSECFRNYCEFIYGRKSDGKSKSQKTIFEDYLRTAKADMIGNWKALYRSCPRNLLLKSFEGIRFKNSIMESSGSTKVRPLMSVYPVNVSNQKKVKYQCEEGVFGIKKM